MSKNSKKASGSRSVRKPVKINNTNASGASTDLVHLSKSASDYARCLANPFTGPLSGIPTYPSVVSFKQKSFIKGTFSSSATSGFGFCIVQPYRAAFNDTSGLAYSTSAFTGTAIAPAATGAAVGFSNSQFTSSSAGTDAVDLQTRLVACGLRVRYVGTELNRGGQKVGLSDPTHSSMNNRTFNDILGEITARKFPVDRQWTTILFRPVSNSELNYVGSFPGNVNSGFMGFVVQAAVSTVPLEFEFEAFFVHEFQGRNVRGITPTLHDPVGFSGVDHVSQNNPHMQPTQASSEEREGSSLAMLTHYVRHGASHVTHGAARGLIEGATMRPSPMLGTNGSLWDHMAAGLEKGAGYLASTILPMLI